MLDAVRYHHDMHEQVDSALDACTWMLQRSREIMAEGKAFNDTHVECLVSMRNQLGVFLGRYERGDWVPPSKLELVRQFEREAVEIIGFDTQAPEKLVKGG